MAWSPDGRTLAFVDDDVFTVPAAGGDPALLAVPSVAGLRATGLAWSPDGARVAYATVTTYEARQGSRPTQPGVYLAEGPASDAGRFLSAVPFASEHLDVDWSPDAAAVAPTAFTEDSGAEYPYEGGVVPAAGGEYRRVAGPAAAARGSALLLVDGGSLAASPAAAAVLETADLDAVTVVGQPDVVSPTVATQLEALAVRDGG